LEEEEDEEKSPRNYHLAVAGVRTLNLCLQSRALYPLDHSALPELELGFELLTCIKLKESDECHPQVCPHTQDWLQNNLGKNVSPIRLQK
jgi:hypothetical protein